MEDDDRSAVVSPSVFSSFNLSNYQEPSYRISTPHIVTSDCGVSTRGFAPLPPDEYNKPAVKDWRDHPAQTPIQAVNAIRSALVYALENIWGQTGKDGELQGKGDLALSIFENLMAKRLAILQDPLIKRDHPHIHDYLIDLIARDESGLELFMLTAEMYLEDRHVPTLEEYTSQCSIKSLEFAITAVHTELTNALKLEYGKSSRHLINQAIESIRLSLEIVNVIVSSQQPNNRVVGYFRYILDDVVYDPTPDIYDLNNTDDSKPYYEPTVIPSLKILERLIDQYPNGKIPTYNQYLKMKHLPPNAKLDLDLTQP